jgi:hypothetical protein
MKNILPIIGVVGLGIGIFLFVYTKADDIEPSGFGPPAPTVDPIKPEPKPRPNIFKPKPKKELVKSELVKSEPVKSEPVKSESGNQYTPITPWWDKTKVLEPPKTNNCPDGNCPNGNCPETKPATDQSDTQSTETTYTKPRLRIRKSRR